MSGANGHPRPGPGHGPTLITGGAGFVGTNLAHRLLASGQPVRILDDLSRPGVEQNLSFLETQHGDLLDVVTADLADPVELREAVRDACSVFHLAAQVAVTTSLEDPSADVRTNLHGTFGLLEEVRSLPVPPPLVFTSTNKVYGALADVALRRRNDRYEPRDPRYRDLGISEERPLSFCTPYGCSKGAADQYVLDYARSYGMPTCVFRMSCIYGAHQFGNEDQGWVAHMLIQALDERPITIFGDGRQVRDILFVDDLVDALLLARERIDALAGMPFNIGGGPGAAVSLRQILRMIAELTGAEPRVRYGEWRPGDQRWYVSDTSRFRHATGWQPSTSPRDGIVRVHDWLRDEALAGAGAEALGAPA